MKQDRSLSRERRRTRRKIAKLEDLGQRSFEVHQLLVVRQHRFVAARGRREQIVGLQSSRVESVPRRLDETVGTDTHRQFGQVRDAEVEDLG